MVAKIEKTREVDLVKVGQKIIEIFGDNCVEPGEALEILAKVSMIIKLGMAIGPDELKEMIKKGAT